jgi:hypothetical protein
MVERCGTFAELPTPFQDSIQDSEEARQQNNAKRCRRRRPVQADEEDRHAPRASFSPAERQWPDASEILIAQQVFALTLRSRATQAAPIARLQLNLRTASTTFAS